MTPDAYKKKAEEKYGKDSPEFLKIFPGNTDEEVVSSLKEMVLMQFAALPAHLWAGASKTAHMSTSSLMCLLISPTSRIMEAFIHLKCLLHLILCIPGTSWRSVDKEVEKTMSSYWINFC